MNAQKGILLVPCTAHVGICLEVSVAYVMLVSCFQLMKAIVLVIIILLLTRSLCINILPTDIDECNITDVCGIHGICNNTLGSFVCSCEEGYILVNKTRCIGNVIWYTLEKTSWYLFQSIHNQRVQCIYIPL